MSGADESTPGAWPVLRYSDFQGAVTFLCDVLGFERKALMVDEHSVVVFDELRWADGHGVLVVGSHDAMGAVSQPIETAASATYLVSRDADAVYQRVLASGADVLRSPDQAVVRPNEYSFTVRDPWGNIWTVSGLRGSF